MATGHIRRRRTEVPGRSGASVSCRPCCGQPWPERAPSVVARGHVLEHQGAVPTMFLGQPPRSSLPPTEGRPTHRRVRLRWARPHPGPRRAWKSPSRGTAPGAINRWAIRAFEGFSGRMQGNRTEGCLCCVYSSTMSDGTGAREIRSKIRHLLFSVFPVFLVIDVMAFLFSVFA